MVLYETQNQHKSSQATEMKDKTSQMIDDWPTWHPANGHAHPEAGRALWLRAGVCECGWVCVCVCACLSITACVPRNLLSLEDPISDVLMQQMDFLTVTIHHPL